MADSKNIELGSCCRPSKPKANQVVPTNLSITVSNNKRHLTHLIYENNFVAVSGSDAFVLLQKRQR
jgi:peptidase E